MINLGWGGGGYRSFKKYDFLRRSAAVSRLKPPDICQWDERFGYIFFFNFGVSFSLPGVLCAYIALFSTSVSYPVIVLI